MASPEHWSGNKADFDAMIGNTLPRQLLVGPPKTTKKPVAVSAREWAGSQVAAYRVGLLISYVSMIFFGAQSAVTGIPTFAFTTPDGWTPIWGAAVVAGGFIAGLGSLRAGSEPLTRNVKIFNRIELMGGVILFLALGTYAALLLIIGYSYNDGGKASTGAGFVALGVGPLVRVLWLIFRPRFINARVSVRTPVLLIPTGYALLKTDEDGQIIPETPEENAARLGKIVG